ncbi:LicD family protein [bacterium]|nr:LicD family protein [bacterium]
MKDEQRDAVKALEIFSDICQKHNIDYYLLAGSCLGGVRHKGMIPWDDDIDVGVPNEQYDKLNKVISEELPEPYVWRNDSDNYPRFYGKIVKDHIACVDIFRLVKFPDNCVKRTIIWLLRKLLFRAVNIKFAQSNCIFTKHYITNPISTIVGKLLSYHRMNSIMRKTEAFSEKHAGEYRINLYSVYSMKKEILPQKWLDTKSTITFEGREYPTVADPHAYLTHLYGDYMTPPPESERSIKRHPERFL